MTKKSSPPNPMVQLYRKLLKRTPVFIRNIGSKLDPQTIFISGNYKTGSTAIAALLARGTRQTITSDIFYRTSSVLKRQLLAKEISLEWYVNRYRYLFAKKIVKEPDLVFYMDQLTSLFPDSRHVFLLRDPRDNIRSILSFLEVPGNLNALSPRQIEQLPGSIWELSIEGDLFGTKGRNYIETQALRWNRIVEIYEQYADRMILFKYETFKQDKVAAIHSLADQLGLPVKADITPFINRQYQPKGEYPKSWLEFYGRENLALIESVCAEKMKTYGYSPSL